MASYATWSALGAIGIIAFWMALGFGWGAGPRIGSAYLPLLLSGLLMVVAIFGLFDTWWRKTEARALQWRPLLAISAAVGLFAVLVEHLGLVPTVLLCMSIAYVGQRETRFQQFTVFAAGFAILVWLVFLKGLGLPVRAFGR